MGQASRTTKFLLDLGKRDHGGANREKRAALEETVRLLDAARAFYVAFFLAHAEKVIERVPYFSEHHQEMRERLISTDKLLTWAEFQTVETAEHPHPLPAWNFSQAFPDFPFIYRRSVIKDAIGKVRSYLSNLANWQQAGKKRGEPGRPGSSNHPTLYEGAFSLELDALDLRKTFVRPKVYDGTGWTWVNYPVKYSRYFEQRRAEEGWEQQSPKLILRPSSAEMHFCHTKEIKAKKVMESKRNPDLVTVAVDLNVKHLAVITVRQRETILETVFVRDHGLDQARYRHLKGIAKKQWQSGKAVKGERSNQQLWRHIRRQNTAAAHKTARAIVRVCAKYPGCILLFERLRKIKPKEGSKSHRLNRKQANQLRGQINRLARAKAFAEFVVTVEVNPWGTSQRCSRCGAKGERFSHRTGQRVKERGGKLFSCPVCSYEAQADYNASVNLHHSFYGEFCWQRKPRSTQGSGHLLQCGRNGGKLDRIRAAQTAAVQDCRTTLATVDNTEGEKWGQYMAKRIIVVDDDKEIREIVTVALNYNGFEVAAASNGRQLQDLLSEQTPDLIILDIMMPGQDGYQIFSALRNDAGTQNIPVIIMTARAEHIYERISVDLGAANHITKPFHPLDLVEKVKALLAMA